MSSTVAEWGRMARRGGSAPRTIRWCALGVLALAACSGDSPTPRGQLLIIVDTDMSVPKDLTDVQIRVRFRDETRLERKFQIPADSRLPGTLAIRGGSDPLEPVSVEVTGLRSVGASTEPRTFAKLVTTIPPDRITMYRMPIQWLCDRTTCGPLNGEERACRAGSCEPVGVEASDLPDYDAKEVFGGGESASDTNARCFDTLACFDRQRDVLPDLTDCTLPAPAERQRINVALRFPKRAQSPGICDESPGGNSCYVPLDQSDIYGWSFTDDGAIQLPEAVCTRLNDGELFAVRVSTACATKLSRTPTCGPWSSIDTPERPGEGEDGGAGGAPDSAAGTPGRGGASPAGGTGGGTSVAGKGGGSSFAGFGGTNNSAGNSGSAGRGGGTNVGGSAGAPFCGKSVLPGPIDDLDDGDNVIDAPYLGYWYSFKEPSSASLSPAETIVPFPPTSGGASAGGYAACAKGSGFTLFGGGIGFAIAHSKAAAKCPVDASRVRGIRFWLRGFGPLRLNVNTSSSTSPEFGGTCRGQCNFHPHQWLTPTAAGMRVEVLFSELAPGFVPFVASELLALEFTGTSPDFTGASPVPPYSFDYCVDDIEFF